MDRDIHEKIDEALEKLEEIQKNIKFLEESDNLSSQNKIKEILEYQKKENIVTINVNNNIFKISKKKILSFFSIFFEIVGNDGENNEILITTNDYYFPYILDFFRYGPNIKIDEELKDEAFKSNLLDEIDFYKLYDFARLILTYSSPILIVNYFFEGDNQNQNDSNGKIIDIMNCNSNKGIILSPSHNQITFELEKRASFRNIEIKGNNLNEINILINDDTISLNNYANSTCTSFINLNREIVSNRISLVRDLYKKEKNEIILLYLKINPN